MDDQPKGGAEAFIAGLDASVKAKQEEYKAHQRLMISKADRMIRDFWAECQQAPEMRNRYDDMVSNVASGEAEDFADFALTAAMSAIGAAYAKVQAFKSRHPAEISCRLQYVLQNTYERSLIASGLIPGTLPEEQ